MKSHTKKTTTGGIIMFNHTHSIIKASIATFMLVQTPIVQAPIHVTKPQTKIEDTNHVRKVVYTNVHTPNQASRIEKEICKSIKQLTKMLFSPESQKKKTEKTHPQVIDCKMFHVDEHHKAEITFNKPLQQKIVKAWNNYLIVDEHGRKVNRDNTHNKKVEVSNDLKKITVSLGAGPFQPGNYQLQLFDLPYEDAKHVFTFKVWNAVDQITSYVDNDYLYIQFPVQISEKSAKDSNKYTVDGHGVIVQNNDAISLDSNKTTVCINLNDTQYDARDLQGKTIRVNNIQDTTGQIRSQFTTTINNKQKNNNIKPNLKAYEAYTEGQAVFITFNQDIRGLTINPARIRFSTVETNTDRGVPQSVASAVILAEDDQFNTLKLTLHPSSTIDDISDVQRVIFMNNAVTKNTEDVFVKDVLVTTNGKQEEVSHTQSLFNVLSLVTKHEQSAKSYAKLAEQNATQIIYTFSNQPVMDTTQREVNETLLAAAKAVRESAAVAEQAAQETTEAIHKASNNKKYHKKARQYAKLAKQAARKADDAAKASSQAAEQVKQAAEQITTDMVAAKAAAEQAKKLAEQTKDDANQAKKSASQVKQEL